MRTGNKYLDAFWLTVLVLCLSGCLKVVPVESTEFTPTLAVAVGITAIAGATPTPPGPSDDCATCGGQGWLGDMRIKQDCPDCDIDWRSNEPSPAAGDEASTANPLAESPAVLAEGGEISTDETPGTDDAESIRDSPKKSAAPVPAPRLVYSTRAGCEPCRRFWETYQSGGALKEYIDANFVLEKRIKNSGPVPTFEVHGVEVEGYRSSQELLNWLKGRKEKHDEVFEDSDSAARRNIERKYLRCGVVPAIEGEPFRSAV